MNKKLFSFMLVLIWGVAALSSKPAKFSKDEHARLMAGEIFVSKAVNKDGVEGVKVFFTVKGTKEDIWRTITDYTHFNEIFGYIEMEVIHEDEKGARVNASLYNYDYVLYHKYIEVGRKMIWYRESGDLKVVSGSWLIESTEDPSVQMISYENYVDAGSRFGNWLAEWGRENRGEDTAKRMRRHVEKLSRGR